MINAGKLLSLFFMSCGNVGLPKMCGLGARFVYRSAQWVEEIYCS